MNENMLLVFFIFLLSLKLHMLLNPSSSKYVMYDHHFVIMQKLNIYSFTSGINYY